MAEEMRTLPSFRPSPLLLDLNGAQQTADILDAAIQERRRALEVPLGRRVRAAS
jgi:hypothetical protein